MKRGLFNQILGIVALTLGYSASITQISYAQNTKFFCGMSEGIPATFVHTSQGNIPMFDWVDTYFPPPWAPRQRCQEISARLHELRDVEQ